MTSLPKISIIIPTFNAAKTLEECLQSVINQTYLNKEIVIIDGGSTDTTLEIVNKFTNHIFYWVSEKDKGIYDAMNKGIKVSTGDWLYFLGSDDKFYDSTILSNIFKEINLACDILYGNVIFANSGKIYDGKFTNLKLMQKNICHQSIFFRKHIFEQLGFYELKYPALADWAFNMSWFTNSFISHKYIDLIIAYYLENGYSFTNPDFEFYKDKNLIQKNFFNQFDRLLFRNINRKVVKHILLAFGINVYAKDFY